VQQWELRSNHLMQDQGEFVWNLALLPLHGYVQVVDALEQRCGPS
jgi:hypothetical protein